MNRLLFMVVLHVSKHPNVTGVLAVWMTRELALLLTSPMLLVLILLRHPYRVEIKHIFVRLGEPQDRLMPARELAPSVHAMLARPDDPVTRDQSAVFKNREYADIQRDKEAIVSERTHLPEK